MRRGSLVSAISSISRKAKQQLTPSSKNKRDGDKHRRRRRKDSFSSSDSHGHSYSDISGSESSEFSSSENSRSVSRRSWHRDERHAKYSRRKHKSRNRHHHRSHRHSHHNRHEDAEQMIELLARMLPFYGTGDFNSDALVIDTIHRLPPHALEIADPNGTTLLLLVCQFAAYDLMPTLLAKGCDVNASNNVGATPLHFACFSDTFNAESAMTLVRHGAIAEVAEHNFGK